MRTSRPSTDGNPARAEVQNVYATAAGGTFTLTFNGRTTSALASSATAADVQDALNALTVCRSL